MTRLSDWYGPPILFEDSEIVRMLNLAKASPRDVLFDLGCGYARNLIVGVEKFGIGKALGVEQVRSRYDKALENVARRKLSQKIRIVYGNMDDLLIGRFRGVDPSEATVVLYTIQTTRKIANLLSQSLRPGSRVVYNAGNGVFPETMPTAVDFPFYMATVPFAPPRSRRGWLVAILKDERTGQESIPKLWQRFREKLQLSKRETELPEETGSDIEAETIVRRG